ncbi:topless-related protein 1-like [Senna tora]|uniref:Topless-related protein 1-like n=1 Tax=Senna tora TaxID=362788 RepID=A0A834U178_9FABA|nr:topless-related protein 1-like [Senna tora]
MAARLKKEIVLLILQYCREEGFMETAHTLERESGCYFDFKHFEEKVLAGKWDDAESYLSNFTSFDDNKHSTKIYFELRKQKFLEALERNERGEALNILVKDLKVFSPGHEDLLKEMTVLLTLDNIREHESLSAYGDTDTVRKMLVSDLKRLAFANPLLREKLRFPAVRSQRLRTLLNQSLNWQHLLCLDPHPDPEIRTLFIDHVCRLNANRQRPVNSDGSSSSVVTDLPHIAAANKNKETCLQDLIGNPDENEIPQQGSPSQALDEVTSEVEKDLPKIIVQTLKTESPPSTLDFHPTLHTLILVGTHKGDIGIWDAISGDNLIFIKFEVWDIESYSTNLKVSLEKDSYVSVNKVIWNPDGVYFGKGIELLKVEAHDGNVNDIAFSTINDQFFIVTCGDDKTVKVWDVNSGEKCYTFDGHDAPVCSICPHKKEQVNFIFSTSSNGNIKAWLYDMSGARVDITAPGFQYAKLAYSADDERLFTCGNGKEGEPCLAEWDHDEGFIKRVYEGLKAPCFSPIQFDTTKNRVLAAGDDYMIKYWDMDNVKLSTSINVDGSLPAHPNIRFNKEGKLLAVTAKGNQVKILAASDYDISKHQTEMHSVQASANDVQNLGENEKNAVSEPEEAHNKSNFQNLLEIPKSQCHFLQLPAVHPKVDKILKLSFTNEGNAILALASNGTHLLWKWPRDDQMQATSQGSPKLWHPHRNAKLFMCNDVASINPTDSVPIASFVISKNDSYLISTSGGAISLFNMVTFKNLLTFMTPPPKPTALAIHPRDNNMLAIGFEDSKILIYNVRTHKVIKLEGHSQRVTSLAFSSLLHSLISADVDGQIFLWSTNGWEKERDMYLEIHAENKPEVPSDTHIQFHNQLTHFLAVQDSHLGIYDGVELKCVKKWVAVPPVVISYASFSSDGNNVYAGFVDGNFAIFDSYTLQPRCRINLTAYNSPTSSVSIYPMVIAANPTKGSQFCVGMSDGNVWVFEPAEAGHGWTKIADDEEAAKTKVVEVNESGVK